MTKWILLLLAGCPHLLSGQFSLTGNYAQDFTALGTADVSNIINGDLGVVSPDLIGWYFLESGSGANTTVIASDGTNLQGDTYHYGTNAQPDRSLGCMQSGAVLPLIGFWFMNHTGSLITSLQITYTGEQWRLGTTGRNDRLDFQYSQNATTLGNGLWVDLNSLDFTGPVSTGAPRALDGNANPNRVIFSISLPNLYIPAGSGCFLRWTDFNASGADDGLSVDDFSITPGFVPAATGYFRSASGGEWNQASTWEYSTGNINWIPSSFVPCSNAQHITIRSGHAVTFNGFVPFDELTIQNGGILDYSNGILTISDGPGSDIIIEAGGVFQLSLTGNPPVLAPGATVDIYSQAILRVAAGGLTNTPGAGVHAPGFLYRHQSILEFTLPTAFGSAGVTYFPNVDQNTIPIFRITQNIGVSVGSVSNTIINGIFEANGNITFSNSGQKVFRNGIRGSGNINGSTSGKFRINGSTAELGGTGNLVVPVSAGLEIGSSSGTVVTLADSKTVTGNITLSNMGTGNFIDLGANNLTISGTISGGSPGSYVRTSQAAGSLTLLQVGTAGKHFPVGETTYNPVTIAISSGTADISARVRTGIWDPDLAIPADGVNRTWYMRSSLPASSATITFQYAHNAGELTGSAGTQPANMELLQSDFATWHMSPGNTSIMSLALPAPSYQVTTTIPVMLRPVTTAFSLGRSGTVILPASLFLEAMLTPHADGITLYFEVDPSKAVQQFDIERSGNGSAFQVAGTIKSVAGRAQYYYTDMTPGLENRYYRIRAIVEGEEPVYSAVLKTFIGNKQNLVSISPNPVGNAARFFVNCTQPCYGVLKIYSVTGQQVFSRNLFLPEGESVFDWQSAHLSSGYYVLAVQTPDQVMKVTFIKK